MRRQTDHEGHDDGGEAVPRRNGRSELTERTGRFDAARQAGASGGTVIAAKGTGAKESEKFLGISLANEKDVVFIVAPSTQKTAIMRAIVEQAGPQTEAGAICFSLPVSQVAGLRQIEADEEAK